MNTSKQNVVDFNITELIFMFDEMMKFEIETLQKSLSSTSLSSSVNAAMGSHAATTQMPSRTGNRDDIIAPSVLRALKGYDSYLRVVMERVEQLADKQQQMWDVMYQKPRQSFLQNDDVDNQ